MLLQMEIGELLDAVRAYNRLIDLRDKSYVDGDVLTLLVEKTLAQHNEVESEQHNAVRKAVVGWAKRSMYCEYV
jgi:hypothetical protein